MQEVVGRMTLLHVQGLKSFVEALKLKLVFLFFSFEGFGRLFYQLCDVYFFSALALLNRHVLSDFG